MSFIDYQEKSQEKKEKEKEEKGYEEKEPLPSSKKNGKIISKKRQD